MAKKIIWATDIHLNFLEENELDQFFQKIKKSSPDILLISGDIVEAPTITRCLKTLSKEISAQIFFVLGNHDYYKGSITQVNKSVINTAKELPNLHFLDNIPYVKFSKTTALIGHSGWADGRYGNYKKSTVMLNDYIQIEEFIGLNKSQRLQKLNQLGDHAASQLKQKLETAIKKGYTKIYCLTHVPPFRQACWHRGKNTDDNFLPHFACKVIGQVLKSIMKSHPEVFLTVLCGHTHSSGKYQALPNLKVISEGAQYGHPEIIELNN